MRFVGLIFIMILMAGLMSGGQVAGIQGNETAEINTSYILQEYQNSSVAYEWGEAATITMLHVQKSAAEWAAENPKLARTQNIYNFVGLFILVFTSYYLALAALVLYTAYRELKDGGVDRV